jgi:hypothetical protein
MPNGFKKNVKRGFNATKKAAQPIVREAVRGMKEAIKREAKAQGLDLALRATKKAQNLFGSGDYRTNNLIRGGISSSPSFGSTTSTFRRREPIGSIISSAIAGQYKLQKFTVNPGLASTFPWLSGLCGNYESYRPTSIVFEYVPTSGMSVASGNTALGSVTMAAQYNPYAADPQNLETIQGYPNAVTLAPYEHGLCGLECKPSARQADTLLIRNSNLTTAVAVDSGADTLFDLCEFFIATEGLQDASVKVGQLWVSYSITLLNPIVPLSYPFNSGIRWTAGAVSGTPIWSDCFYHGVANYMVPSIFNPQLNPAKPIIYQLGNGNNIDFPSGIPPGRYEFSVYTGFTGTGSPTGQSMALNALSTNTQAFTIIDAKGYPVTITAGGLAATIHFYFVIDVTNGSSQGSTRFGLQFVPLLNPANPINNLGWVLQRIPETVDFQSMGP